MADQPIGSNRDDYVAGRWAALVRAATPAFANPPGNTAAYWQNLGVQDVWSGKPSLIGVEADLTGYSVNQAVLNSWAARGIQPLPVATGAQPNNNVAIGPNGEVIQGTPPVLTPQIGPNSATPAIGPNGEVFGGNSNNMLLPLLLMMSGGGF